MTLKMRLIDTIMLAVAKVMVFFSGRMFNICLRFKGIYQTTYYSKLLKHLGKNTRFSDNCIILQPELVSIGDNCTINSHVCMSGHGEIKIGNGVRISPMVTIISTTLDIHNNPPPYPHRKQGVDIVIEDEAWLATGARILAGVTIGKGAIVAAGCVVTKDVEPYTIVGGVPGKVIGYVKSEKQLDEN